MYKTREIFDSDVVTFRNNLHSNDIDLYEHYLVYKDIECVECGKVCMLYSAANQGWWIDELLTDCRDLNKIADICFECRNNEYEKHSEGSIKCERCTRYGELCSEVYECLPGEEDKILICLIGGIDVTLCYECHHKIHYNN